MIDLLIVGAGPAGLMAAKRSAELGLNVTVIEIKKDLKNIKRACSAQFVMDKNYEGESVEIENHKIFFNNSGFNLDYSGPFLNIIDNYHHSPSGHKIHFAHEDHRPFAVRFDKSILLQDLCASCKKLGVNLIFNTIAYRGIDMGDKVMIDIKNNDNYSTLVAKKLIIAEGANAKLTGIFGLNKGRKLLGSPFVVSYTLKNTTGFEKNSWNQYYGDSYHPYAEVIAESDLHGDSCIELTIMGNKILKPDTVFEKLKTNSPLSKNLEHAELIDKKACTLRSYESIKRPYLGNVLVIGDSAAHVEVIVQGALMCGYHAGNAIKNELLGKNGFLEYTTWWNNAFEFNCENSLEFIKLYGTLAMKVHYSDDELDYLFSLLDGKVLNGNFNQYEVPKTVWNSILQYKEKIKEERPELFERIKKIDELSSNGKLKTSNI